MLNREKDKLGFCIDGFWCSVHKNYKGNELVEIFHMKQQRGQRIKISIQQFRKNENSLLRYDGIGLLDSNYLSLVYHCRDKEIGQSGVMELERVKRLGASDYFRGSYHEQSVERTEMGTKPYPSDFYKLYKIKQPDKQMKWFFYRRQPLFSSFQNAKNFAVINQCTEEAKLYSGGNEP